jgi:hypothetical protein
MIVPGRRIARRSLADETYLLSPDPGPVGVNVDPLGEAFGPRVLPDGLWVLFGLVIGAPVTVPVVEEPVVLRLAAIPAAVPWPLCATAKELVSASAVANEIVLSFMLFPSLGWEPR